MRLVYGGNRALNYDICLGWPKQRMLTMSQRPDLWKYQCMYWNVFGPFEPRGAAMGSFVCGNTGWNNGALCGATDNVALVVLDAHLATFYLFPSCMLIQGGFSISFPEPATVSPDIDFNSVLVSIPVSRGRVVVGMRTI